MCKRIKLIAGALSIGLLVSGAAAHAGGTALTTIRVASNLDMPLFVTHAPGDANRIYIVEKPGRIKVLDLGTGVVSVFLDITARVGGSGSLYSEQGLLGLAFHPNFATNKFFYVNYTNNNGNTRVSRFVALDPDTGDDTSEFVILSISQPQSNHNGGWLEFGPNDGYLYVATGDGGNFDDLGSGHTSETGNGQDITSNLLGKILRIDVDGGSPYAIPPDNPFVGITGDDEIWAYGLRNPWRNAFDPNTGDLYIADVGQERSEEISFQPASSTGGENYGWRCREGAGDFIFTPNCVGETFVDPIHEYSHGGSPRRCSITGGEVYHGCAIPDLIGTYFFADWCSDSIWSFRFVDGVVTEFQERTVELAPGGGLSIQDIASFGTDADGEMYICDHGAENGEVYKIVATVTSDCNDNGKEDLCDIVSGDSLDDDENGIPDECEMAFTPLAPNVAWPKNRYLTFEPNNVAAVALQVELSASLNHPDAVGFTRWVDVPDEDGIARLSHSPITRIWTEEEVHATGCEISPVATYRIRATIDGGNTFSPPLQVGTSPLPDGGKSWGDTVRSFDGNAWSAPQQNVNMDDAIAAIHTWQARPGAPHTSVCDLAPQSINGVVNCNDVLLTLLAFQGDPYPFGCPTDPCQNASVDPCP